MVKVVWELYSKPFMSINDAFIPKNREFCKLVSAAACLCIGKNPLKKPFLKMVWIFIL